MFGIAAVVPTVLSKTKSNVIQERLNVVNPVLSEADWKILKRDILKEGLRKAGLKTNCYDCYTPIGICKMQSACPMFLGDLVYVRDDGLVTNNPNDKGHIGFCG